MGKLLPRALGFALLALVSIAVLSAAALIAVVGLPDPQAGASGFTAQAVAVAPTIDLVVGGLGMILFGWLAGRPFAGRDAASAAALTGLVYIALDLATVAVLGRIGTLVIGAALLGYAVKLGGALIGGAIASRGTAPARE
jgi:hypothetical protein